MNEELDKTEAELDKVKEELHKAKEELAKAKEELDKTREESHKTVIISISNEELDKIRKIKDTPSDDRKKGGCWIPAFFLWRNHYLDSKCFYKQPLCRGQSWCFGFFWPCPQHVEVPRLGIKPEPPSHRHRCYLSCCSANA